MLLIYTHQITNRVKYTFNLFFGSVLGIGHELTTDKEKFKQYSGPKLSYTTEPVCDEIFCLSDNLLFESGIKQIELDKLGRIAVPGPVMSIFSHSFFLATRYEEYNPFAADKYGRFSAKRSYGHLEGALMKPIINIWAQSVKKELLQKYSSLTFPEKKYSYTPTIDIDNAYAYLGKNTMRAFGGYVRSLAKMNWEDISKRKNVLSGKEKDPYDTYDLQFELHKKYGLSPIYFFLLGDWAPNDKNLSHTSPLMQDLIKKISSKAETGIHPSYASNEAPEKVKAEKERLEKIIPPPTPSKGGQTASSRSRQHFLKLSFPDTYRNLIAAGITDDYTMGYADEVGFRAGICTPFKWYDLEKEEETSLTIHPFAVMDGTLNSYLKLTPEQALEKVKNIIQEVKNVNGELITIWHNETLSDWREWKGWGGFYEEVIKAAAI